MKEKELAFSDIPRNFLWCINRQCPKAATCLRQLAERLSPVTLVSCETINPNRTCRQMSLFPFQQAGEIRQRFPRNPGKPHHPAEALLHQPYHQQLQPPHLLSNPQRRTGIVSRRAAEHNKRTQRMRSDLCH